MSLKIENVAVDSIYSNPENVNIHPSKSIDKIRKSIEEFGLNTPLGVRNNYVIVGNGRYEAIQQLEWEFVPIVRLDHLSDEKAKAYAIADNRTAYDSFFDDQLLREVLKELEESSFDLDTIGFDDSELDDLFEEVDEDSAKGKGGEEEAELTITPELLESHNYIVLYFDNDVDWINAVQTLKLEQKQALFEQQKGLGRVIKGVDVLNRIKDD